MEKLEDIQKQTIDQIVDIYNAVGLKEFRKNPALKALANKFFAALFEAKSESVKQENPFISNIQKIDPMDEATFKFMNNGGFKCPCCEQTVAFHTPTLSKDTLKCLYRLYLLTKKYPWKSFYHMKNDINVPVSVGGNWAKLRWWGLIEPEKEDGKKVAGMWAITDKGRLFCEGKTLISEKIRLYNRRYYGQIGNDVYIHDLISKKELNPIIIECQELA